MANKVKKEEGYTASAVVLAMGSDLEGESILDHHSDNMWVDNT